MNKDNIKNTIKKKIKKEEHLTFFENCIKKMKNKEDKFLKTYGFGKKNNNFIIFPDLNKFYLYNKNTGDVFFEAKIQIIGTYSPKSITWRWAWANRFVPESLRKTAFKIMEFGKSNKIDILSQPRIKGENLGLIFTALAIEITRGKGFYIVPRTKSYPDVFLIFTKVKKIKKKYNEIISERRNFKIQKSHKYKISYSTSNLTSFP